MYVLSFMKMKDVPSAWRPRLRELSFGPDAGGMWAWTYQDGSCWVAVLQRYEAPPSDWLVGQSRRQEPLSSNDRVQANQHIVAWAALTKEVDSLPVVGCYVAREDRRAGLGKLVSAHLLQRLDLPLATAVYAVSENWAAWPKILSDLGLVHFEWE